MQLIWCKSKEAITSKSIGVVIKYNGKHYLSIKVTDKQVWTLSGNRLDKSKCSIWKAHGFTCDSNNKRIQCLPHYRTYPKLFETIKVIDKLPNNLPLKVIWIHTVIHTNNSVRFINALLPAKLLEVGLINNVEEGDAILNDTYIVTEVINKNNYTIHSTTNSNEFTTVKRCELLVEPNKRYLLIY